MELWLLKKDASFVNVSTYNLKMRFLSLRIKFFWLDFSIMLHFKFRFGYHLFLLLWNWFRMIPLGKSRKFVCFCYFVCLFDKTVDWVWGSVFPFILFDSLSHNWCIFFYCFRSVSRETIFPDFPEAMLKSIGFM